MAANRGFDSPLKRYEITPRHNLVFRLTKSLQADYPDSCHVKDVNPLETDDMLVWQ